MNMLSETFLMKEKEKTIKYNVENLFYNFVEATDEEISMISENIAKKIMSVYSGSNKSVKRWFFEVGKELKNVYGNDNSWKEEFFNIYRRTVNNI